jgi:hypothetical protein
MAAQTGRKSTETKSFGVSSGLPLICALRARSVSEFWSKRKKRNCQEKLKICKKKF